MGTAGKPLKREKNRQPGVTELVTPGIAVDENLLDHKSNNFLASLHLDGDLFGVSFLDFSTGEFFVTEGNQMHVERSEEHTSELQSRGHLVCRLLLEKKKKK